MGFRAYARHRGCTLRAVQLAIESKRINTIWHKGQIKIDSELADRDWEANTNDAMARNQGPNYNTSRAVRETYQAKIARLDYEERCNKLVDAEMVKREGDIAIAQGKLSLEAAKLQASTSNNQAKLAQDASQFQTNTAVKLTELEVNSGQDIPGSAV